MDKYVIKTPRPKPTRSKVTSNEKELKQVTILSLKRVVVVEDIQRCKVILEIEDQNNQVILDQLKILEEKIPSKEVLEETKIGLTLNKLRKHSDSKVSEKATQIYREWKKHFKEKLNKPKIEVRFDHATNKYRSASKRLLEDRLQPHKESSILAEAVERSVFKINHNTGPSYKKHIRSIVFALKYQPNVQEKFLNKQMTVDELCLIKRTAKQDCETRTS